jgi:hypothetical protein
MLLTLIGLFSLSLPLLAAVEVTIDRNPVQVNESFQLVFTADSNAGADPDFSVLQQNFLILGNNRNNISIINGEYRRSVKWTLQLMATKIGEFEIPSFRFGDDSSEPLQVTVNPSALGAVPQDEYMLELAVDKSSVAVQSQVILSMRLLSATDISAYQFGDIDTQGLDLVVEPLGDVRQYQTRIGDRTYLVLEKEFALFPQQSGRLEIPPVLAEVRLLRRSTIDPFNSGGKVRRFRSQPVVIDVAPVPPEFSGDHWLPANRIELREQWSNDIDKLVAGEPITRSIVLVADGLTAAQLPEIALQPVDGLKQYPDQPVLKDSLGRSGVVGRREQKVALIPIEAGVYRIPEISINWWNRISEKLETARLPARDLRVTGDAAASSRDVVEAPAQALPAGDRAETSPAAAPSGRFWPWMSLLLACGLILSNLYWWQRMRPRRLPANAANRPDLSSARRELQQACLDRDAGRARMALLAWGRALLAPQRVTSLNELCHYLGDDLRVAVDQLNQSRYAAAGQAWQGEALWQLCQQLERDHHNGDDAAQSELLPLNP